MAVARTLAGTYREIWVEAVPLDGGTGVQTITTAIKPGNHLPPGTSELDFVEVYMYLDSITGTPVLQPPGGVAVLELGGNVAAGWPAALQNDVAAGATSENCLVGPV